MKFRTIRLALVAVVGAAVLAAPALAGHHEKPSDADIVDTAAGAGTFSTLLAAADAAGLVDALRAEGPLTVFAPTDDAFARLPEGTVESLLEPENLDTLRSILTYHVVAGRFTADRVVKASSLETLNGAEAPVSVEGSTVTVGGAVVTATDIMASNGVIHVIDRVIMPPAKRAAASSCSGEGSLVASGR